MPGPGRPPSSHLDPREIGPIEVRGCTVDHQGRISIPAGIRGAIPWIQKAVGDPACLLVLDLPGRILLLDAEESLPAILTRRAQLRAVAGSDPEAEEALLALEDRYLRARMRKDGGRLELPGLALLHLSSGKQLSMVAVARTVSSIEIWSPAYRYRRRRSVPEHLLDLP